ncbi:MAG: hypothetical protein H7A38_06460 [Chlamydiales bacterium]|nr:hypothetical protein [Chlamydiales bacterium]
MGFVQGNREGLKLGLCVLAAGTLAYAGRESVSALSNKVGLSSRIDRMVQNGTSVIGAFSLTETIVISPFKWSWSCVRYPILSMKNIPSQIYQVASFTWGWTLGLALGGASYVLHNYVPSLKTPLLFGAVGGGVACAAHLVHNSYDHTAGNVKLIAIPTLTALAAYQLAHRKTHLAPGKLEAFRWSLLPALTTIAIEINGSEDPLTFGLYTAIGSALLGAALIALGKTAAAYGRFLKTHGSVLGTGLVAGLTTAAMVPLSKKSLDHYAPTYLANINADQELLHRALLTGAASALLTILLVQRLSLRISGSSLSLIQRIGLGILSAPIAGISFLYVQSFVNKQVKQVKPPPSREIIEYLMSCREIMKNDGGIAFASALATLAVSVVAISVLILTKDGMSWAWARKSAPLMSFKWACKWTWTNHPEVKGVVATAATSSIGYGIARVWGRSKKISAAAAALFAILGAPSVARHTFSYDMGSREALTSLFAGLLMNSSGILELSTIQQLVHLVINPHENSKIPPQLYRIREFVN